MCGILNPKPLYDVLAQSSHHSSMMNIITMLSEAERSERSILRSTLKPQNTHAEI